MNRNPSRVLATMNRTPRRTQNRTRFLIVGQRDSTRPKPSLPRTRRQRVRRAIRSSIRRDVIHEVTETITSSFRRTPFTIAAIVVGALVLTSTPTSGPIYDLCHSRTDALCTYLVHNFGRACGYAIFCVAVIDIPAAYRLAVAAAVILWVYIIPEASPLEYVLQALLVHSYFRVRTDGARFLLIAIGLIAYFAGYIVFKN
nr:MAG: hypothetical protein [Dicrocoelium Nege-like virius]